MKSNIKWIIIFAALCGICMGIWKLYPYMGGNAAAVTAKISQNGGIIKEIDLSAVRKPYEFEITDDNGGSNTIRVENGRIAVVKADCPDKICVKHGFISDGSLPIVCLPHKLSITVSGAESDYDAVAGND